MLAALLFGLAASSALVIGGVAGGFWRPPRPLVAVALALAGGAVLASLADTLMPDAYREGDGLVAFATAAGFFVSFVIENAWARAVVLVGALVVLLGLLGQAINEVAPALLLSRAAQPSTSRME